MKLTNNNDFFQKTGNHEEVSDIPISMGDIILGSSLEPKKQFQSSAQVTNLINETVEELKKCGFPKMAERVSQIRRDTIRQRFVVSVVGEFNHGKSTFLNHLLGDAPKLPVGNLPTTAILTRIRYAQKPQMVVFDEKGDKKCVLPIKPESWKGLVANNFGEEEPRGSVIMGIPDAWLGKNSIEIIDCPGAGDLSEARARVIGDVLTRSDSAIIALNATAALSNSEKLFIKNRILSRKTPFTMIIVNKLDMVKKEERNKVVKYIKDVLALEKMEIPVYIPADIEMPDETYADIKGLDKIKEVIVSWAENPQRQLLTDLWIKTRITEVVDMAIDSLDEQDKLLKLDDDKRKEKIAERKQVLDKLELDWNELEVQLQNKSNVCYKRFLEKVDEYTAEIIEKLHYEASHTNNPEKWWTEDYPYRLKMELANMSVALENIVSKIVISDARWFNDALNQEFKSTIRVDNISVTDKDEYKEVKSKRTLEFEDLTKKQNIARIGTAGLSLAMFPVLGIVATLGVGTAGSIITSSVFRKKIEEQKKDLRENISKDIPSVVAEATLNSEKRIIALYDEILADSQRKKEAWHEAQVATIETDSPTKVQEQMNMVVSSITSLQEIKNKLS
jgi:GTP-binding protein EngB required for normal cell division